MAKVDSTPKKSASSDDLPKTRSQARAEGIRHFYTGAPCKRGHIDVRRTSNGSCLECERERCRDWRQNNKRYFSEWYKNNRDSQLEEARNRYRDNRDAVLERTSKYRKQNRDLYLKWQREWYQSNRETHNKKTNKWRKDNPGKVREYVASRRHAKDQRAPKWVNRTLIRLIYSIAARVSRETGIPHEVDHIIPLRGEFVSGLHVPDNLQLLTATENRIKSNKFNPN